MLVTNAEEKLGVIWRDIDLELGDAVLTILRDARSEDGTWDRGRLLALMK